MMTKSATSHFIMGSSCLWSIQLPNGCQFARAQQWKENIRSTAGHPFGLYNICNKQGFFYPIQDYMKSHAHKFPIAYGLKMTNGGAINEVVMLNSNCVMTMTDWFKFDKTIPVWLVRSQFSLN